MRGDIIKLSAEDAVARAHIVRMCWDDINTLVVITSEDNSIEVRGDDARRVWREWTESVQQVQSRAYIQISEKTAIPRDKITMVEWWAPSGASRKLYLYVGYGKDMHEVQEGWEERVWAELNGENAK